MIKRIQLAQKLTLTKPKELTVLIGFDGFRDTITRAVRARSDASHFEPFHLIQEFSARLLEAAGKGCLIELAVQETRLGGNSPIAALALGTLGATTTLIAALGETAIDPLFHPVVTACKEVHTIGAPGETDAIEFDDGKIMLGKHAAIQQVDIELLYKKIGKEKLVALFEQNELFVSNNWAIMLHLTEIWKALAQDIAPRLSLKPRSLFIDLTDPSKRSDLDIQQALDAMKMLKSQFSITLGLNEGEALRLLQFYGRITGSLTRGELVESARFLREQSGLHEVVIHTVKSAAAVNSTEEAIVDGPFIEKPKISTGGGDNFNAGFLAAKGYDLSLHDSLLLAVATSGFYVRNGKSPTIQEVCQFLRSWDK